MPRGITNKTKVDLARELAELQAGEDLFLLSPEVQAELEEQGLVGRFINAKKFQQNYGYHKSGWRLYKRDMSKNKKQGSMDFVHGSDPEGYIRRADLILAVKSKEEGEKQRRRQRIMTAMQSDVTEMQATQLEDVVRRSGIKADISKGYNSN